MRPATMQPFKVKAHTILTLWKARISGYLDLDFQGCGIAFWVHYALLKNAFSLHEMAIICSVLLMTVDGFALVSKFPLINVIHPSSEFQRTGNGVLKDLRFETLF